MDAFEALYRKHVNAVFRFSVRAVGRCDIAEEITSEAFLALFRNMDRLDLGRLPAWLFTVAKNRAMDYWRRQALEQRFAADCPRDPPVAPEPAFERCLFDHRALKRVHRVCLILRYVHGMSRDEMAQQTGLSENQIKGHLQYARQILRRELARAS